MASRAAFLSALLPLLLGGCLKAPREVETAHGCRSCHPPHYVLQATCQECHRGDAGAARKELAHAHLLTGGAAAHTWPHGPVVSEGKQLVERLACRRCHTVGGEGNRLAAELDRVVWKRDQQQLFVSITAPVQNMPSFGLDRPQVERVIAFLLSAGSRGKPLDTYRVHFDRGRRDTPSTFDEKCGGCHRFLGSQGARGAGSAGPNLSGLFTPFYPKTAPGERSWTAEALADWVRNPRSVRPATTMPPVPLTQAELERVTDELTALPSRPLDSSGPSGPMGGADGPAVDHRGPDGVEADQGP